MRRLYAAGSVVVFMIAAVAPSALAQLPPPPADTSGLGPPLDWCEVNTFYDTVDGAFDMADLSLPTTQSMSVIPDQEILGPCQSISILTTTSTGAPGDCDRERCPKVSVFEGKTNCAMAALNLWTIGKFLDVHTIWSAWATYDVYECSSSRERWNLFFYFYNWNTGTQEAGTSHIVGDYPGRRDHKAGEFWMESWFHSDIDSCCAQHDGAGYSEMTRYKSCWLSGCEYDEDGFESTVGRQRLVTG